MTSSIRECARTSLTAGAPSHNLASTKNRCSKALGVSSTMSSYKTRRTDRASVYLIPNTSTSAMKPLPNTRLSSKSRSRGTRFCRSSPCPICVRRNLPRESNPRRHSTRAQSKHPVRAQLQRQRLLQKQSLLLLSSNSPPSTTNLPIPWTQTRSARRVVRRPCTGWESTAFSLAASSRILSNRVPLESRNRP